MITTDPVRLTMADITSSTVSYPDTGEAAWSAVVTYAAGETKSYQINGVWHRFESRQGSNLNHLPTAYPDDASNLWWLDLGWVNQIAAFQLERNTQTITASPYVVAVDPGERFGAIGIGNIQADDVLLEVYDGVTLIHSETKELKKRDVYDWYSWTYEPFYQVQGTIFTDIPINSSYTFKLTFTDSTGTVKVGSIIPGVPLDIGKALIGTSITRLNYSLFERDEFGDTRITIRRNIPRLQYTLLIEKAKINNVMRLLDDLNGLVTFYAGIVETEHGYFDSVFVIGLYKEISYQLNLPNHVNAAIEIEAL